MKVKYVVTYEYLTNKQKYHAELELHLPALKGELHPLLCNNKVKVIEVSLDKLIGTNNRTHRIVTCEFYGENLETIQNNIDKVVKDTYSKLKQVYNENKEKLIKSSECFELELDETS